ncbi:MAG: DVUA0089 family protein [Pirellula sp.]
MVSFTVSAGQAVDFDIDTTLNGPGGLGSYIRLFNGQGTELAINNDAAAPGEGTIGFDAYLRFTFSVGGTYYLGVSNFNNVQYNPLTGDGDTAGGLNSTGSYQLIVQTAAAPVPDPNDTISEAASLGAISTTPITVNATISPDIDVNMVSFTVSAGQLVDFDIDTALNGSGGLNSFLKLFDAQGQLVRFNNNASAPGESVVGFDAYVRHSFLTAGTYFIAVSNDSNTQYNPLTGNGDLAGGQSATGTYQLVLHSLATVLAVSIHPTTIPEKNGTAIGTVSRIDADIRQAVVIGLRSSDVGSATVPATVVIPANQTSVGFTITTVDDEIVSGTKSVTITATSNGFTQGASSIDILDNDSLWHNASSPHDVDGDNSESPLDVLTIVNFLNSVGSGPVGTGNPPPYLDVDSDNYVSPLDVLVVINFLNSQSNGQGEGESANKAVPFEFVDEYFSNLAKKKTSNVWSAWRGARSILKAAGGIVDGELHLAL